MKKNIFISALLLFIINFESVFAEKQSLKIGILNGPSAIPSSYLIENKENFKTSIPDFQLFSGADTELPKILKGEIDIGILPPNAAAKVYNSSNKIIMLAVIGNGNVSLLTTKDDFKNLASLKGTTVYCAGRGATPDNIFRYILSENNIQISDEKNKSESVTLDFSIPTQDLATSIVSGKTDYILVPEPFATVALIKGKNSGVKKVFNLSDSFTDNYPLTLLVCNKNSLSEKKDAVDEYLSLYKNAVKWTIENPEEAGKLVEKHTLGLNAAIASASIPNGEYVFIPAQDSIKNIEFLLQIFLNANPESVGGKLPDKTFYYNPNFKYKK